MSERGPKLLILCVGYPSTGKTTSSHRLQFELSRNWNAELLTTLSIRQSLGLMDNLYSEEDRERVYSELVNLADKRLKRDIDVLILDGNFNRRSRREKIYALLENHNASLIIIECKVDNVHEVQERLNYRKKNTDAISNKAASIELYNLIKESSEPLDQDLLPSGCTPNIIEYDTDNQQIFIRNFDYSDRAAHAVLDNIATVLMMNQNNEADDAANGTKPKQDNCKLRQPRPIRAFIFDIGGVIQALRWESVSNRLNEIKPNLTMDEFRNALYYEKERYFGQYEVAKQSYEEFWGMMARRLDIDPGQVPQISEAFKYLYGPIDSDLAQLIMMLKKNYQLFILSNSCPELEQSVNENPVFYGHFQRKYFSHKIGYKKPQKESYQYLLDDNKLEPEECYFIDDASKNVVVAQELGINALLFLSNHRLKADLAAYLNKE